MSVWTITCLVFAVFFGIMAVIFALMKEKGAMLISGFNTLPEEEREKYDKMKMSTDMRNSFFLWFVITLSGAVLSHLFGKYFAIISIGIWAILFFKDVHIDPDKAFAKYGKY